MTDTVQDIWVAVYAAVYVSQLKDGIKSRYAALEAAREADAAVAAYMALPHDKQSPHDQLVNAPVPEVFMDLSGL